MASPAAPPNMAHEQETVSKQPAAVSSVQIGRRPKEVSQRAVHAGHRRCARTSAKSWRERHEYLPGELPKSLGNPQFRMTSREGKMAVPRHLSPAAKRWFRAVSALYELETHHFLRLTLACEAWDRCAAAAGCGVVSGGGVSVVWRAWQWFRQWPRALSKKRRTLSILEKSRPWGEGQGTAFNLLRYASNLWRALRMSC
jgi:hypothetical protein